MFVLFAEILVGSAILNLPAVLLARRRYKAVWWLPFIGAPATLGWITLVALGVGPQSLSNIVELVGLAALSVVLCYAQVLLLDRHLPHPRRTSTWIALGLVATAVVLRLSMPLLPE
jgi:hypothetical protein